MRQQSLLGVVVHCRDHTGSLIVLARPPQDFDKCIRGLLFGFDTAVEAVRVAVKYRTPVVVLSDGYLANSAEPWKIPDVDTLPRHPVEFATDPEDFTPYHRDAETLARLERVESESKTDPDAVSRADLAWIDGERTSGVRCRCGTTRACARRIWSRSGGCGCMTEG